MKITAATSLLLALATTACTNMSGLGGDSKFKCPVPDEVPCMSMSDVDASYRAGALPGQHRPPPSAVQGKGAAGATSELEAGPSLQEASREAGGPTAAAWTAPAPAAKPLQRWAPQRDRASAGPRVAVADREPAASAGLAIGAIRTEPTLIRIWIAPWEDADGDLNDQGYVYLQIDAGRWLIEHNREQIRRTFAPAQAASGPPRPTKPVGAAGSGGSPGNTPAQPTSQPTTQPPLRPTASSPGGAAASPAGSVAAAAGTAGATAGAGR